MMAKSGNTNVVRLRRKPEEILVDLSDASIPVHTK
jgi:hypothetical protein